MSRVVALIQARMGSTRFPGKMLADLGGRPILEWVIQRVSKARMIDTVVLATTALSCDDALVALAQKLGIKVFRGSEADVLDRFAAAAAQYGADIVVRICADNPFIDAVEIDRLVHYFNGQTNDYACNHQDRLGSRYADGFGAEILSNDLLQKIATVATDIRHREHATLYIWDHASEYRLSAVSAPCELAYPDLRFDVDQQCDLTYLNTLINDGVSIDSTAKDIVRIALSCGRITLVTTDMALGPPSPLDNSYFLGAWCFSSRHDEKLASTAGRIIDFHWNDRDKLKRDFDRLHEIQEELLEELSVVLNQIHGVNESKRFWRLLLGYWLNIYTTVLYDRWSSIEQASEIGLRWQTHVLPINDEILAAADTADFIQKATESTQWNHSLFALLLQYFPEIKSIPVEVESSANIISTADKYSCHFAKQIIKDAVACSASQLSRRDRIFLMTTYIPVTTLVKLELAVGQLPLSSLRSGVTITSEFDKFRRQWSLPGNCDKKNFDLIVRELLPKYIPRIFLEGFLELVSKAKGLLWPKSPKVIFTSNLHFVDDLFKAWAAQKIAAGARLVIGEHGGLGTGLFNGAHRYEVSIADVYLSTGWSDANHQNIVPVGNFRIKSKRVKPDPSGKALLVCGSMPRYSFDIRSMMLSSQVTSYFDDQLNFLNLLPDIVRTNILVRLQPPDYGWQQEGRLLDRFPDIAFDDRRLPMMDVAVQCRLFIATYNATTYIEALALNFPTVMFWNPLHWEIKPEAQPFFDKLRDIGIFHDSAEGAAKHVANIWNDILGWWQSESVQSARKLFCDTYSASPTNIIGRLKTILLEEANHSTILATQ